MASEKVLRILIVEDEMIIALELESLLQDAGHEVVGLAMDSRTALANAKAVRPDLALVDIHLLDGPTGVDVARALSQDLGITVIFMTANAKRIPEDCAGAAGLITKPYTERGIREALDYVLAERPWPPPRRAGMSFVPFPEAVTATKSIR